MDNIPKANLADLLIDIRGQLVEAKKSRDEKTMDYLGKTVAVIAEFAYKTPNGEFMGIMADLEYTITDYYMGVEWKSNIPSEDEIRRAFDKANVKEDS